MGIDYGIKRCGVAISDPLGLFASPLETVASNEIIAFLKRYGEGERVVRFVVGYPINMDNTPSQVAPQVEKFVKELKKHFPSIPVTLEDERFTSQMAFQAMIDGGVKKMARRDKKMVDKISAAIILQSWLDRVKK